MAVQNRIVKVQKRNRALVKFDDNRIRRAIFYAAQSIGGFAQDRVPGVNETVFEAHGSDEIWPLQEKPLQIGRSRHQREHAGKAQQFTSPVDNGGGRI